MVDKVVSCTPLIYARPAFSMGRLRKAGSALGYRCAKQHSEPGGDKRADQCGVNNQGAKADELTLAPLELIDRIAALVPPPRTHRHRYFGVLAPDSPLRAQVTAMAQSQTVAAEPTGPSPTAQAGPPRITPARGAPLWEECDAQSDEGTQVEPDWDTVGQPTPDFEVNRQVSW